MDPAHNKSINDGLSGNVDEWYGRWPAREAVDDSEEVLVAVGGREGYEVDVEVLEPLVGDGEVADGRHSVSGNF